MNTLAKYWVLAELCSHDKQDSGDGDDDKRDYIKDLVAIERPTALFTQMGNDVEYCYIMEMDDEIAIVFRGTDGDKAWRNNFRLLPPYVDGYMHRGFYELAESFIGEVVKYIKSSCGIKSNNLSGCKKKVTVTGHSLGGILSQYIYKMLWERYKLVVMCINFGAPCGGTKKWAEMINKCPGENIRVVNGYDIVTEFMDDTIGGHGGKLVRFPCSWAFKWLPPLQLLSHAYSQYTKALIKYSQGINDTEAVTELQKVLKRCNI